PAAQRRGTARGRSDGRHGAALGRDRRHRGHQVGPGSGANSVASQREKRESMTAADCLRILQSYRRIAMVGLSANPMRPSYFAAIYMLSKGYDIVPINPRENQILGRACYPSVRDAPGPVEIVDIFREPSAVPGIVEDGIE